MNISKCPYCEEAMELKDSKILYGKSYGNVWICSQYPKCDAYVGCHGDTEIPLGTPANKELREVRKQAHEVFDKLYKVYGLTRKAAYTRLQIDMDLSKKKAHIAKFDIEQCKRVISIYQGGKL